MPYRDAHATLVTAVTSVLAERGAEIELVAIDDGSKDEGPRRIAELAADDARIVRVESGGVGIARALSRGLEVARGDLIARMDADDESLPGRFARQCDALARDEKLAVVGTRVEAFGAAPPARGTELYLEWLNSLVTSDDHARDLFVESPLCHPSVMMRRAALEGVGAWRDVAGPEDYDLWLRFDRAGWRMAKVPEVLFRWRQHDARATIRDPRYAIERFTDAKAHFLAPRLAGMGRPITMWGAGPTGKRLARALEREGVSAARFVDIDPRKVGGVARGVGIVAPSALHRGDSTIVVAVGARGARELIRAELVSRAFVEGEDFICAS